MARESEKARKEREAFQLFAERLGVRHKWLSIESRKPDEPDLLGVHMEHGQIAFELVRICDSNIAEVRADGHKAHQAAFLHSGPVREDHSRKAQKDLRHSASCGALDLQRRCCHNA